MVNRTILLTLAAAGIGLAQPEPRIAISASVGGGVVQFGGAVVQGAPYSATVVNESVQTLADGNRIVQRTSGQMARDSQGRTRQNMSLPPIGNMSAANAPQLVFINDPVGQTAYQLNLTEKTAFKLPMPPSAAAIAKLGTISTQGGQAGAAGAISARRIEHMEIGTGVGGGATFFNTQVFGPEPADVRTEDLGTQTMQGVSVQGTRTTRTIPAGQIGNDKPIEIVTEVWTSPELKTIVYSKRSDPRTGEQTFQLTNIVRSDPDASFFAVPPDFKLTDGPGGKGDVIFYRSNE